MARPSCQVLTRHNTRNVVLMLLVLSKVGRIKPCWCRAMPRPAQPMPYPIQSCHFVPFNVSLAVGVYDTPSQCNAYQPMLMARELSTPLSCRGTPATSTIHMPPSHLCQTSWCAVPSLTEASEPTLNTVKNTTMSTLHIKLILLPSPEAHARVLAKLMTACHSHRLQRCCECHGASGLHFVLSKIQYCEGAVCLGILEKCKHHSQRANDCMPSRRSRAEPRQFLHIRMSVKRHAVPDPVVSSHVKSCLTGHCPAT